uniref:Uncharacterized protein n=1 Tax=Oryza punctata TaxID=4537 RepID=A0A0E0K2P3_ORYPU
MPRYGLFAAVKMEAVLELQPIGGGFDGTATSYFLQLRCATCREDTGKKICLYPGSSPCSFYLRSKNCCVYNPNCFPKCKNPGHIVRKIFRSYVLIDA